MEFFRDPKARINLGLDLGDQNFKIPAKSRVQSLENPEISEIGNAICKTRKIAKKRHECKIPKLRGSADRDIGILIPGIPNLLNFGISAKSPGFGIFTLRISRGFFTYYVNSYIILYLLPELSVRITRLKRQNMPRKNKDPIFVRRIW